MILAKLLLFGLMIVGISGAPSTTTESGDDADRILHGTRAPANKYPYQTSVQRMITVIENGEIYSGVRKFCGAVIIAKTWILTAAHCFDDDNSVDELYVNAGVTDAFNYEPPSQLQKVGRIITHPEYSQTTLNNDIALLQLEKSFKWSASVQKISLPSKDFIPKGDGNILGFGATDHNETIASRYLLEADIPVSNLSACSKFFERPVTEKQICLGYGSDKIPCAGDSGGPFLQKERNRLIVVGITSYGNAGCYEKEPVVYTRVSAYLDWILTTIKA